MSDEITKKVLQTHLEGHLRIYEFIEKENPIDDYWKEELENEIKKLNPTKINEEKPKPKSCQGCMCNEEFTGICRNKEGICFEYNKYKPIMKVSIDYEKEYLSKEDGLDRLMFIQGMINHEHLLIKQHKENMQKLVGTTIKHMEDFMCGCGDGFDLNIIKIYKAMQE